MRFQFLSKFVPIFLCLVVLDCCPFLSRAFASGVVSASPRGANESSIVTIEDAQALVNLLPATKDLRAKGMVVKWEVQTVPDMNNKDYYFFWIYNATAQGQRDIGSISVGNYAVNKHTADMRAWHVSDEVFHGDDGELITTNELARLQEELRKKYGIDSTLIQKYRFAHLANKSIPREQAQSVVRLPIDERSRNTIQLSCWKDSDHLISRLGRSPVISSTAGYRAYAEVKATTFRPQFPETYRGPLCENSIKLFFARDGVSKFQTLLDSSSPKSDCATVEGRDSCEVKGIQLVDWSKDGRFLLVDLVLWVYESDALSMRVPIVYDVMKSEFMRPDVYRFFDEYYKTDAFKEKSVPSVTHCEFQLHAKGFSPEGNIILLASRPPNSSYYEQVFCLDQEQTFEFDPGTNRIKPLPSNYKTQRYGIRDAVGVSRP